MVKTSEILQEDIASSNKTIDEIKQSEEQLEISKKKNCPFLESGPTYSDSPSDNANSSITSSPTDTLRTLKGPTAKIIKNKVMKRHSIIIRKSVHKVNLSPSALTLDLQKQKDFVKKKRCEYYVISLYNAAIRGEFYGKAKEIGLLTESGKIFLEKLSGLKLRNKVSFVLNPSDLCHINSDHFGKEKDEGNNIPLEIKDIRNLIYILMSPDIVMYFNDKYGRKSFYLLKNNGNGTYNIDEIYASRNGNLTLKTMYKTKKSTDQRVMDLTSLLSTSGTYSVVNSSDAKIPILFQCASENLENIK